MGDLLMMDDKKDPLEEEDAEKDAPLARVIHKGILIERTPDGRRRYWELKDVELQLDHAKELEQRTQEKMEQALKDVLDRS